MFLPHEWGPDPDHPDSAACVWCREPFVTAGGTVCALDARRRSEATDPTLALPELPDPPPPLAARAAEHLIRAALVLATLLTLAALLALAVLALLHSPACG